MNKYLMKKNINLNQFCLYIFLYCLIYFLQLIVFVFKSQNQINIWNQNEIDGIQYLFNLKVQEKDQLFRKFEVLHLDKERIRSNMEFSQDQEYNNQKRKLIYLLMRQEFISPSFFPVFQENFLRDDFNFSQYLQLSITKGLKKTAQFSDFTKISLIVIFIIFSQVSQYIYFQIYFSILYFIPLLFIACLVYFEIKHQNILNDLTHHIQSPYEFSFNQFERDRDPYINIDKLKKPKFLQNRLKYQFFNSFASKQDRLFHLSSQEFHYKCLNLLMNMNIIWLIEYVFSFEYRFQENAFKFMLDILIMGSYFFQIIYLFPENITTLSIITSIQQMRNKKMIKKVIKEQKLSISQVFTQLHRLIKQSRRTVLNHDQSPTLSSSFKDSLITDYLHSITSNSTSIPVQNIRQYIHLIGHDLEAEQLNYLLKQTSDINTNKVLSHLLISYSRELEMDSQMDTYKVMKEGLLITLQSKLGSYFTSDNITLKQLRTALMDNKMIHNHQIERALGEIKYLGTQRIGVTVELIASLISNLMNGFMK